jgi:AcrR family transcriptional regulator
MPIEQRREQILAAATTVIAERGFWATSWREVADACGITVTGWLHHFETKETLLLAVLDRRDRPDVASLWTQNGRGREPPVSPSAWRQPTPSWRDFQGNAIPPAPAAA